MSEQNSVSATIERLGPVGMITLRGDLENTSLQEAAKAATGSDFPATRRIMRNDDSHAIGWMSPDEVLLMVPYGEKDKVLADLDKALVDVLHLAVDVSDARARFAIKGNGAREVLAKGAPVDMSPSAFTEGQLRRTRLGQLAAAFWMTGADGFELVTFRSVGDYVETWLQMAAKEGSSPAFF